VTLHQDAVTLQADLKGLESVKEYYTTYFDQYTYTHVPLVSAANINTNTVFSFGIEKVKSSRLYTCFVMVPALTPYECLRTGKRSVDSGNML
jgi:hypothetical protein